MTEFLLTMAAITLFMVGLCSFIVYLERRTDEAQAKEDAEGDGGVQG